MCVEVLVSFSGAARWRYEEAREGTNNSAGDDNKKGGAFQPSARLKTRQSDARAAHASSS